MKTALVTGATGFIGANIARILLERGVRVRVLVRATSNTGNIDQLDVEVAKGDLRDAEAVSRAVKGCDEVYHAAAEYNFWSRNPQETYASNVHGTRNIMDACMRHGIDRVVYTSTVGAIGLSDLPGPCNELTPLLSDQLTGHYKLSKYGAEQVALSYVDQGLPLVVVNPSAPVGPWDRKPTPTGKIIVDFVRGKMPAYVNTGLNIVHVQDVAMGHVLAAEKGRIGERYILGNENMSLEAILGLLSELTGKPRPKIRIPYGVAWTAGYISTKLSDWITHRPPAVPLEAVKMAKRCMYFDSTKARSELGFATVSPVDAFKDALSWFSKYGYFNERTKGHIAWQFR